MTRRRDEQACEVRRLRHELDKAKGRHDRYAELKEAHAALQEDYSSLQASLEASERIRAKQRDLLRSLQGDFQSVADDDASPLEDDRYERLMTGEESFIGDDADESPSPPPPRRAVKGRAAEGVAGAEAVAGAEGLTMQHGAASRPWRARRRRGRSQRSAPCRRPRSLPPPRRGRAPPPSAGAPPRRRPPRRGARPRRNLLRLHADEVAAKTTTKKCAVKKTIKACAPSRDFFALDIGGE